MTRAPLARARARAGRGVDRAVGILLWLPAGPGDHTVPRGVPVPMRDGATLLARSPGGRRRADLLARSCEVDVEDRLHNLTDAFVRLPADRAPGEAPATGTEKVPSRHAVAQGDGGTSRVRLPVISGAVS